MIKCLRVLISVVAAGAGLSAIVGLAFVWWSSEFARRQRHDALDPRAYMQGLIYAWGRNDQKDESEGDGPIQDAVEFAKAWAEAFSSAVNTPNIRVGFENFRDHGLVLGLDEGPVPALPSA